MNKLKKNYVQNMLPHCTLHFLLLFTLILSFANAQEMFKDYGPIVRVGQSVWGGGVAAIDGAGKRIILFKFWGGEPKSTYLLINADTGKTVQIDPGINDTGSFATFLSPQNLFYDSLGSAFTEFDPAKRTLRKIGTLPSGSGQIMPVSITCDDNGVVYAGVYPGGELLSYNPKTKVFKDYGSLVKETWPQYLYIAPDEKGWLYGAVTFEKGNLLGFNPATGEKKQFIPQADRKYSAANRIFRANAGKVYAQIGKDGDWYRLYNGKAESLKNVSHQYNITLMRNELMDAAGAVIAPQARFTTSVSRPGHWPDGSFYSNLNVADKTVYIYDKGADKPRAISFDYACVSKNIYSIIPGPDKKIYGSTGIPLRIFSLDPKTGKTENWGLGAHGGHVNQWTRLGNKIYGGVYSDGELIEFDVKTPFDNSRISTNSLNPRLAYKVPEARDVYGRPHAMMAHPDGKHIIMGGNPARGLTGGGFVIYNIETGTGTILSRGDLIQDQGVYALCALPNGDIIAGTLTAAATGGTRTAKEAVVYRVSWESKKLTDTWVPVSGLDHITDLITGPDGLIYGLADPSHFFVIDPRTGKTVHHAELSEYGSLAGGFMARRVMALGEDKNIYVLFRNAIARIIPGTFVHQELTRTGITVGAGIIIQDNKIFFSSGGNMWSADMSAFPPPPAAATKKTAQEKLRSISTSQDEKDNVTENPGFEQMDSVTGLPSGWSLWANNSDIAYCKSDSEQVHEGRHALKLVDNNNKGAPGAQSEPVPALPGEWYEASAMVHVVSGSGFAAYLQFFDSAGKRIKAGIGAASGTGRWTKTSVQEQAPENTATVNILCVGTSSAVGTAFYDSVMLKKILPPKAGSIPTKEELLIPKTIEFIKISLIDENTAKASAKPAAAQPVSATSTPVKPTGKNLIINHELKNIMEDSGLPENWSLWGTTSDLLYAEVSKEQVYDKGVSVKIVDNDTKKAVGIQSAKINITPGTLYSAYVMAYQQIAAGGIFFIMLQFFDETDKRIGTEAGQISVKNAWVQATARGAAPEGAVTVNLLCVSQSTTDGAAWFSALHLEAAEK